MSFWQAVVVRVNDACADHGRCDKNEGRLLNIRPFFDFKPSSMFNEQINCDLCEVAGVAHAFFGTIGNGIAIGAVQYKPYDSGRTVGYLGATTGTELALPC